MALQKKNDLLSSHLVVLVFWFIVLFLFSRGFDIELLAKSLSYAMILMACGLVIGVTIWFTTEMLRRDGFLVRSMPRSARGAKSSIGDLPAAKEPDRGKVSASMLASRLPWWNEYKKNHPRHAEAFMAIFAVMYKTPRLPASPVPGGHGGATLIDHSFNVVKTMMEMAPKWSYRGHKNKRGEITFPLLDNTRVEFRFDAGDPIIPLTAFSHDIGKTVCYKMAPDGSVVEVRKNHDVEGAKLLRRIPEVMNLPWKDLTALLIACEYYHHIGSLPHSTWIDDRARSLIELLIAADIATGQREGGVVDNEYQGGDFALPQMPTEANASTEEPSDDKHLAAGKDEDKAVSTSVPSSVDHGTALDLAYSVLLEPGRVNGKNTANRIAWKHGEWLYISDAKLRLAVASMTGDSSYSILPHRGNMHKFTLELMAQLAEAGNLLQEHNGLRYSEKRALFTTRSNVAGKAPVENKFVIVANVRAFPGLENTADCKTAPEIVGCTWGEHAAIDKASTKNCATEDGGSDEGAVDASGEVVDASKDALDAVEVLRFAAAEMQVPFVERTVDGEDIVFFEEDVVKDEFPEIDTQDPRFIRKSGGKSGKAFIGIRKQA